MTQPCARCGLLHPDGTPCFSLDLPAKGAGGGLEPLTVLGGRYAIVRTIHRGGMSVVYLATDRMQGRQVAIKELRLPDGATEAERAGAEGWFARESYLLSTLRHPLIPQFYSVFRDLKPANILLRQGDKTLVVVDFGIARPFVAGQAGTVVGTPGYAPPEQYQGLATPQSDIYALGATLRRLLTGHDLEAHAESGKGFGIPPALVVVVARALELAPAARYASAAEMGEALLGVRQQSALGVYPPLSAATLIPLATVPRGAASTALRRRATRSAALGCRTGAG